MQFFQALILVLGLAAGDLVYLCLAIAGLTALALVMGDFFLFVRLVCATYLCYLGWKILKQAGKAKGTSSHGKRKTTYLTSFALGFGVSLGNPKAILFYVSLMPTFVDVRTLTLLDTAVLSAIVLGVSLIVLGGYAVLAIRVARFAVRRGADKRIDQLVGAALIGAGVFVAARSQS